MFVSETFTIHDRLFYDPSSSQKLSHYTALYQNNSTLSYDSTESAYLWSKTGAGFRHIVLLI